MAVPPFPSQDLAKLVLGYLAEEQLMTAYDEFLQASPYLDALQNEYDRIFMTSLKNILAEYRAVKIYVETCKPFLLRKKLFQCPNLLEIVKFLVNHIDVKKIYAQDAVDMASFEKSNVHTYDANGCEICNSLKLVNCVCKSKHNNLKLPNLPPARHAEEESLQNLVETTSLADLPGNHVTTRKKHVKVLEKCSTILQFTSSSGQNSEMSTKQSSEALSNSSAEKNLNNANDSQIKTSENNSTGSFDSVLQLKASNISESRQKVEEFNNVLNTVCTNNTVSHRTDSVLENVHKTISCASTFQDFASGVRGSENANMPDSSTSENLNFQAPIANKDTVPEINKPRMYSKIGPVQSNLQAHSDEIRNTANNYSYPRIRPKTEEPRVKIISDVKVDNSNDQQNVHFMKNATSTPLIPMQTIYINGKPAYRTQPFRSQHHNNFTKDEIMAMPTIILVPASGSSLLPNSRPQLVNSQSTIFSATQTTTQNSFTNRLLGPLVIDVPPSPLNPPIINKINSNVAQATAAESVTDTGLANVVQTTAAKVVTDTGLVKTVDVVKCGTSVPKDNIIACSAETSTPLVLPNTRKSSSTPRRTSHVRVLDFATPRRILYETVNEKDLNQNNDHLNDVVITKHPNMVVPNIINTIYEPNVIENKSELENSNTDAIKENSKTNKTLMNKKNNWDADLRALAVGSAFASQSKPRSKLKHSRKKRTLKKACGNEDTEAIETNISQNQKITKNKHVVEEDDPDNVVKSNVVVIKPTINIKPGIDYGSSSHANKQEDENNKIKPNDEERVETPEVDRISLQNAIGAKLNISELLETPYKQAFYDIQMETPRFLGPDLPDAPMSDIKIMNIPTPRFFDSPKLTQATPSSYSSRPTDYSSGGSYYKPDDQDYQPVPDLRCPVTSSKDDEIIEQPKGNTNYCKKSSRPVRKCAKNVSYYKNRKITELDDKTDVVSTCSDTASLNSSFEIKIEKEVNAIPSKECLKPEEDSKPEAKKKPGRKRKSPTTKEKPKTFMKIKPRRTTPTKETIGSRGRKRKVQNNSPKLLKHRTTSKDKSSNVKPVVTSAPTKSRRKSSTPRKLQCSKTFNSESSGHDSPEVTADAKPNVTRDTNSVSAQDSDTEQIALRWSDDGSQDVKDTQGQINVANDSEDITKIKKYIIETTVLNQNSQETESILHIDLVKRGFDIETARIIERDLLDTPPHGDLNKLLLSKPVEAMETNKNETILEKTLVTDGTIAKELLIIQDDGSDNVDEIELSVYESNVDTDNYVTVVHDDTKEVPIGSPITLKDKFSMEVCIDDDVAIRLRATQFTMLFDQDPVNEESQHYSAKETEDAVKSICNIDKLYTPLKESIKAQCFDIFDSTLTSLDTPLKKNSPKITEDEVTVTEIILESEKADAKERTEPKKRKRIQSSNGSDESLNENKKPKPDPQYLLTPANIHNMDIESVLIKLHGA